MKIGFLGGSFDPVHFGHMVVAQDAFEQQALDRVVFVPAAQAALKPNDVQASPEDRLGMLTAVLADDPRFAVSDHEVRRGGISYTIDSARHFRALHPKDTLFWIVGADQLPRLHLWKEIHELVRLVSFLCLDRPGHAEAKAPEIPGLNLVRCRGHLIDMSSTEIRARVRDGRPVDYFVPHKAIDYLQKRGLYQNAK